jgi:hypothetical protein
LPPPAACRGLFQVKSLDALVAETVSQAPVEAGAGAWNIIALGVGAIIGAGIFATIGTAAARQRASRRRTAIVLSFILTAVSCGFIALCYAEFASMVPVSGSAYTYAYGTLRGADGLDHRMGPDHQAPSATSPSRSLGQLLQHSPRGIRHPPAATG